ncbi:hypothetical protein BF49_3455 [Bradyrhizobium sp.]|nr:hypothetical protein BF49_3455 [Bradyrhizobium sp.]
MQGQVAANHFDLNDACRLLSGDLSPSDAACRDWINAVYDNDTTKLEIFSRECGGYHIAHRADRMTCGP